MSIQGARVRSKALKRQLDVLFPGAIHRIVTESWPDGGFDYRSTVQFSFSPAQRPELAAAIVDYLQSNVRGLVVEPLPRRRPNGLPGLLLRWRLHLVSIA